MAVIINIFKFFLNLIYALMKLFPVKNKAVILSRQSDEKTMDIKLLEEEIAKQDHNMEVVCLCMSIKESLTGKIRYLFHMMRQMYHIATARIVVVDGYCMSVSLLNHRKDTVVVQMWHALGSLKKFGYSIFGKEEGRDEKTARLMNMHRHYDIVFTSSNECIKNFAEAFDCSEDIIYVESLPRVDAIKDEKYCQEMKDKILKTYPQMKDKKNIVYAPTFRKNSISEINAIESLVNSVDLSKYNLIIKTHPLTCIDIDNNGLINDKKYSSVDMFTAADFIILDYSAIVYEAALMEKPVFFYAYDFDKYKTGRDFYIDYKKEMPGFISKDPVKIMEAIEEERYDQKVICNFAEKYVEKRERCTFNMVKFILNFRKN